MDVRHGLIFGKALILTIVIGILWTAAGEFITYTLPTPIDPAYRLLLPWAGPAFIVLLFVITLEIVQSKQGVFASLSQLGFKAGNIAQYRIALIGLIPVIGSFAAIFLIFNVPTKTADHLSTRIISAVFSQGIVEEIVFRGFIFRNLRKNYSFWRAAAYCGILFGGIHLDNFVHGFNANIAVSVMTSIIFGFIFTFPFAALFETGAGSIFACTLIHVAVDAINWFPEAAHSNQAIAIHLASTLVSAAAVIFLFRKWQFTQLSRQNAIISSAKISACSSI